MAEITFGGEPAQTAGDLPSIGSKAPEFRLTSGDLIEKKLSDFLGKTVILNIFPSIGTGVCQNSVRNFNKMASSMKNVVLLNISRDLPFSLNQWCGNEGINDAIVLSELRDDNFSKDYNVRMMNTKFKSLFSRVVIILNSSGKVIYHEQVKEIGDEPNYNAALKIIQDN
tara:strand:- start:37625 stop:38131 length:507 start_codon:yes stop_codon:yes gene_type:complete